jgi:hypothetical protein
MKKIDLQNKAVPRGPANMLVRRPPIVSRGFRGGEWGAPRSRFEH